MTAYSLRQPVLMVNRSGRSAYAIGLAEEAATARLRDASAAQLAARVREIRAPAHAQRLADHIAHVRQLARDRDRHAPDAGPRGRGSAPLSFPAAGGFGFRGHRRRLSDAEAYRLRLSPAENLARAERLGLIKDRPGPASWSLSAAARRYVTEF